MPRFTIPPDKIPNTNSLEELAGMSYVYASKEEEDYYTKWRRDLEGKAYTAGEKNAFMQVAKNLAGMGMNTENIAIATGLSSAEINAALQSNS